MASEYHRFLQNAENTLAAANERIAELEQQLAQARQLLEWLLPMIEGNEWLTLADTGDDKYAQRESYAARLEAINREDTRLPRRTSPNEGVAVMEDMPSIVNISFSIHSLGDHTILSYQEQVRVTQNVEQWSVTSVDEPDEIVGWAIGSPVAAIADYLKQRLAPDDF